MSSACERESYVDRDAGRRRPGQMDPTSSSSSTGAAAPKLAGGGPSFACRPKRRRWSVATNGSSLLLAFCAGVGVGRGLGRWGEPAIATTAGARKGFPPPWVPQRLHPDEDGPPPGLVVYGSRRGGGYTPVPPHAVGRFNAGGKGSATIRKAFAALGRGGGAGGATTLAPPPPFSPWKEVKDPLQAQLVVRFKVSRKESNVTSHLQPWQRYSRIPGWSNKWESKDLFLDGLRKYSAETGYKLWFLPVTYRVTQDRADREAFLSRLAADAAEGKPRPWVLKQVDKDNGSGIEMLPPESAALATAVDRVEANPNQTYVVQQYICNELTWNRGQKFDLRMYFLVASVDPLVVLMGDGYVRVGANAYDEANWESTGAHLTNHQFRGTDEDVTHLHLWDRIRGHYEENRALLRDRRGIEDPVRHVRSQMKEALGRFVAAFSADALATARRRHAGENFFAFYGCDFILDADLDVWFIEAQGSPGLGEAHAFRSEMWQRLFRPMIRIVDEIQRKQQQDATQNLLPLKALGGWEIVYAGDWIFEYHGYTRRFDEKKPCSVRRPKASDPPPE